MKETISALLDGECSPGELDRLLAEMDRDPALLEQFSRQVLARESRMGGRIRAARLDFSSRVLAGLGDERPTAAVLPFTGRVRRLPWKAMSGLAAAAAVGAMAVLAVKPLAPQAPQVVATTSPSAAQGELLKASAQTPPVAAVSADEVTRQQLRNYLRAYSHARGQQHMRSTLGYARYAAYSENATPATGAEPKR